MNGSFRDILPIRRKDRDRRDYRICRHSRGYTLIELVSVTALATILVALAVAGYHTWTRDNAVTAGQQLLQSALIRARAYALAHGVQTRCLAILRELPERSDAVTVHGRTNAASPWLVIMATNALPNWVVFDEQYPTTNLFFLADGSCQEADPSDPSDRSDSPGWLQMGLRHTKINVADTTDPRYGRYRRALEVNRHTGLVREAQP